MVSKNDRLSFWRSRKWRVAAGLLLAVAGAWLLAHGQNRGQATKSTPRASTSTSAAAPPPIRFENRASDAGLNFVLENSPTPQKHLIETMTGGIAAFDYNGDGLTDIFFANGAAIPSLEKDSPRYFNRLFRNDGNWKFTDVTREAGVAGAGFSMGAAAADFDNDGRVDLFVPGVFHNLLYRNRGDGTFEDITAKSGIKSDKWSVAAGWFDYDKDGRLDLFVVNYARWSVSDDRFCGNRERNIRVYCHPQYLDGLPSTLYHNRGDGTFEDVTEPSGIGKHRGRGMSVAFADYDQDGLVDAFVTNDNQPNFLFHNRGNGTFEETALAAGVALMDNGSPVSSMGVDFRDYNNDGLPDIAVTDLTNETFPLFRNLGKGMFEDATMASQVARITTRWTGWSNGFFDFNNDGWKDLFTANAHVDDNIELFEAAAYKQPNGMLVNQGNGTFLDVSEDAGFRVPQAHRGAAFADFNRDGRIDVVTSSLRGPAELWENTSPGNAHWIVLKLEGKTSNRDGIGATVRIGRQVNQMSTAVGYSSSSHFGVHFGLGNAATIPEIEIRWPSGKAQVLKNAKADQYLVVKESGS